MHSAGNDGSMAGFLTSFPGGDSQLELMGTGGSDGGVMTNRFLDRKTTFLWVPLDTWLVIQDTA